MLGEQLFKLFDTSNSGLINFEEFISGIAKFSKGSVEEKYRMIFDLYDLCGDGYIDKAELVALVKFKQIHNSLKETLPHSLTQDGANLETHTDSSFLELAISARTPKTRCNNYLVTKTRSGSFISFYKDVIPHYSSKAQIMANQLLEQFGDKGVLNFNEFVHFISQYPQIIEVFEGVFKEDIWSASYEKNCPKSTTPKNSKLTEANACCDTISS